MQDPYPQIDGSKLYSDESSFPPWMATIVLVAAICFSVWAMQDHAVEQAVNEINDQEMSAPDPNEAAGETLQRIIDVQGANRAIELGEELPKKLNLDPPVVVEAREPIVDSLEKCQ